MKYGEDYKTPCIRYAVATLSDQASHFEAALFFRNLTTVGKAMKEAVKATFSAECYSTVTTL